MAEGSWNKQALDVGEGREQIPELLMRGGEYSAQTSVDFFSRDAWQTCPRGRGCKSIPVTIYTTENN